MGKFSTEIDTYSDITNLAFRPPIDVTEDTVKLDQLKERLDNTEYGVGVYRTSNFKITLRNDHGRYAFFTGDEPTIFDIIRNKSFVRLLWEQGTKGLFCGFFNPGEFDSVLSEQVEIFEGYLSDETSKESIDKQVITFNIQGFVKLIFSTAVPSSVFNISSTTAISTVIKTLIDAAFDVDDWDGLFGFSRSVTVGNDVDIDSGASLENKTILEALKELLFLSNSVLYIIGRVITVSSRTANATVEFNFFGASAYERGIENIIDIKNYRDGQNRIINHVTWNDTTAVATDPSSIATYTVKARNISSSLITNGAQITSVIEALRDTYAAPKRELTLVVPWDENTRPLRLNSRVSIDNPTMLLPDQALARYGAAIYDTVFRYGTEITQINLLAEDNWQIIARTINFDKEIVEFQLRET